MEQVLKDCSYDCHVVYSLGPEERVTTAKSHKPSLLKKYLMPPIHLVYGIMKNSG